VDQARTEARAEAEVATEQRVAAALALERAELDKQARSWLCMCGVMGCSLHCPGLCWCTVCAANASGVAKNAMRQAAWAMMIGMSCSMWKRLSCS